MNMSNKKNPMMIITVIYWLTIAMQPMGPTCTFKLLHPCLNQNVQSMEITVYILNSF